MLFMCLIIIPYDVAYAGTRNWQEQHHNTFVLISPFWALLTGLAKSEALDKHAT